MSTPTIRAKLTRLDYETFLILLLLLAFVAGSLTGLLLFVAALAGEGASVNVLGIFTVDGFGAGLFGLIGTPLYYMFVASLVSPILYFPFRWILRALGGLRVRVEPEVRPQPA